MIPTWEKKKKEQTQACRSQALSPPPNKSKTPTLRRATSMTLKPRFSVFNPPVEPAMEHKTVLVGVFKEKIGHLLSFHASSVYFHTQKLKANYSFSLSLR